MNLPNHLLDSIQDGIQVWSRQGELLDMNTASLKLLGLPESDAAVTLTTLHAHCTDASGQPILDWYALLDRLVSQVETQALLKVSAAGGEVHWLSLRAWRVADDADGHIVSICTDVTRFVQETQELQHQAQYDALTNLPNRVLFADRLHQALAYAQRRQETLAVCMLDLDGFKPINDRLGHKAGDRLLQEIAYRLQTLLRGEDTAARLGGDEFGLLIGGLRGGEECEQILDRVLQKLALPVVIDGQSVSVTASIGVSLYPGDIDDPDQLLRHADVAMYKAKEAGKGCFRIFDPAVANKMQASRVLLKKIVDALDAGQFHLYYQPQVDCRSGRIVNFEALARWQHPVLGLRHPGEFLPLIEKDDTIIQLGEWAIREALEQIAAWRSQGLDLSVSVNIAARQFLRGNFARRLEHLLAPHDPYCVSRLGIEIVETAVLEDINAVSHIIHRYHGSGIKFSLDDFGTGYSSLIHLKRLAADALKIDQSFVRTMLDDPGDLTIVQGVINLAQAFRLGVVAEGVENIEQLLTLMDLGCHVIQGYVIARPMPAARVADWVRNFTPDPRWRLADTDFPGRHDFELLLGKVMHRHWLHRLQVALVKGDSEAVWPELDAARCRVGHWCETARSKYPELRADIGAIEAAHGQVHRLAQNLHQSPQVPAGRLQTLQLELSEASNRLLDAIDTCRAAKH